MSQKITLQLSADTAAPSEIYADWQCAQYVLNTSHRGGDATASHSLELNASDVLELELEDGHVLLVAAEDAPRYLGTGQIDAAGKTILKLDQQLQFRDSAPTGTASRGVGLWLVRVLRVFQASSSMPAAAFALASQFEMKQLAGAPGLFQLQSSAWNIQPIDKMPLSASPCLLFIHGTASSTEGSFRDMWRTQSHSRLAELYQDRIYGFEHYSLTESPISNALQLVRTLPKDACLHIVSHSRGGMVGELLARANRQGDAPFSEVEIQRFLQNGKDAGRKGYEKDAEGLRELNALLKEKSLRIERFVRVAATARGTTLASGRLDRWATVMLNLFGVGLGSAIAPVLSPGSASYALFKRFLLALVKERTDARVLPGLEAMMPDSPLVALLNAPDVQLDAALHVIAGNYKGEGLLPKLWDYMAEAFYGGQNDLVVNTPSMSGGAQRIGGIWQKYAEGRDVTHFRYFIRPETCQPLLNALAGDNRDFEKLAGPSTTPIARGEAVALTRDNAPIVLMLPGIMGSYLAIGSQCIWFSPARMIFGQMARLRLPPPCEQDNKVNPDGWDDNSYAAFARCLHATHEVRPFVYDWRLSLETAAEQFGVALDRALNDAKARKQPLRIVAHSMGGLVARLALSQASQADGTNGSRWEALSQLPGSRLIQFGVPNQGSHGMAAVLTGRDAFVQKIERWADWMHDMHEFIDIVRGFPGVLELLPWPKENGLAEDGVDYFSADTWAQWQKIDQENRRARGDASGWDTAKGAGDGWPAPEKALLDKALAVVKKIQDAPLRPDLTLYVAGANRTPAAIRFNEQGEMQICWVEQGDGRVLWKNGPPPGVPVWRVNAAHGDLLSHEPAFPAYLELLQHGRLISESPVVQEGLPSSRGDDALVYAAAPRQTYGLYPTAEEVLAAALGKRPPAIMSPATVNAPERAQLRIHHGSLANSELAVLVGVYSGLGLHGSTHYLDGCLDGALSRGLAMGCFPSRLGEAMFFPQTNPSRKPGGAVLVGLGVIGELQAGELTRALSHGLLEYARAQMGAVMQDADKARGLSVASLLVGTGQSGMTTSVGMTCLAKALSQANTTLHSQGLNMYFAELHVFEEEECRAIAAADTLGEILQRDERLRRTIEFSGKLHSSSSGYRGLLVDGVGDRGWHRVHITRQNPNDNALRFTLISEQARNLVVEEPDQRQFVDGLIAESIGACTDQPGLSRALFELMVPNQFKSSLADAQGMILAVDVHAGAYPWELMRHLPERDSPPLATQVSLIRQLATPHGRLGGHPTSNKKILLVADTQSGLVKLGGASGEGKHLQRLYEQQGYEVAPLFNTSLAPLAHQLFDHSYQVLHFAAHGVVNEPGKGYTGLVLGNGAYLTSAQVNKLPYVPELVFINCCHLGDMAPETQPRWGELAANLSTQFIEMGSKAVVAAGWVVNDAAASSFASTFHEAMLAGQTFAQAVLAARQQTYQQFPGLNTWGAYQAYGDERYRLAEGEDEAPRRTQYVHAAQMVAELAQIRARLSVYCDAAARLRYQRQLEEIERSARASFYQNGPVREQLGSAWAAMGEAFWERAIEHYREALSLEDSGLTLRTVEQLANLEIRKGQVLQEAGQAKRAAALLEAGVGRLDQLMLLGETSERLSLRGSGWKRRSLIAKNADEINKALLHMFQNYQLAVEHSERWQANPDYYPLLNQLDAALLLRARSQSMEPDMTQNEMFATRVQAAKHNAEQRNMQEASFFHQVASIDADRALALWRTCAQSRDEKDLTLATAFDDLRERYLALFKRLGSRKDHDSVVKQIEWLAALWPDEDPAQSGLHLIKQHLNQLAKQLRPA